MAPLKLGLGVQVHHNFATRFLIDSLHEHEFSSSYAEVIKYERSAVVADDNEIQGVPQDTCIQYIADNVDHYTATLDGRGTFHGMCIVAALTPGRHTANKPIPKVQTTDVDIAEIGRINIDYFKFSPTIPTLYYQPLPNKIVEDPKSELDLL